MRKTKFSTLFLELDGLIRAAQGPVAAKKIKALLQSGSHLKITRDEKLSLAGLARRASVPNLGLKILQPYIRPNGRRNIIPTDREKNEFAACLLWVGALTEAESMLADINPVELPSRDLFQAFVLFARWNYRESITYLRRYTQSQTISDYERLVGLVNLASAYVHERMTEEARSILAELESITQVKGHQVLLSNVYKLRTELLVDVGEWREAEKVIQRAFQNTPDTPRPEYLFLKKWEAIVKLKRNRKTYELAFVRKMAEDLREWETLRECDYHEAVTFRIQSLGQRVFNGTPYQAYRDRLLVDFPDLDLTKNDNLWHVNPEKKTHRTKIISLNQFGLKQGQVQDRLLRTLCQDFYGIRTIPDLYGCIFPKRFYNPNSSPNSVHQALKRLRESFQKNNISLKLDEHHGQYRLFDPPECIVTTMIQIERPIKMHWLTERAISKLTKAFGKDSFSLFEASQVLNQCSNSVRTRLKELEGLGYLKRLGRARATRYQSSFVAKLSK